MQGGAYADYVGRAASIGSAKQIWSAGLDKVAGAVGDLAGIASTLGVNVKLAATAADVAQLFAACRVITILAHWRGPEVTSADIRVDPLTIADQIEFDSNDTAVLLREGLPNGWRAIVASALTGGARTSRLAELLDVRLRYLPALERTPAGTNWHMDPSTLRHFNRSRLDAWWPEAFVPGNCLELADGLHPPEILKTLVPDRWSESQTFPTVNQLRSSVPSSRAAPIASSSPINSKLIQSCVFRCCAWFTNCWPPHRVTMSMFAWL